MALPAQEATPSFGPHILSSEGHMNIFPVGARRTKALPDCKRRDYSDY